MAEACARRWFLDRRIPCWTDPSHPGEVGRYGLLFRNGRRALIFPSEGPASIITFDDVMKSKCDYLIPVALSEGAGGEPGGFLHWYDLPRDGDISAPVGVSTLIPRRLDAFPELAFSPRHFVTAYLAGSLRLLLRGESSVPAPLEADTLDEDYVQATLNVPDPKGMR